MYIIHNGIIVQPDRLLRDHDVIIEGDRITGIVPAGSAPMGESVGYIDAHGGYITPGFIDIHSDYIENVASPRPTVLMDFSTALFEAERELLAHGVTTIFHSLSIYKVTIFDAKPIRKFENVEKLMALIEQAHRTEGNNGHLIRHRLHARVELDNVHLVEQVAGHIENGEVDLLSFMDHTPGQGQYRNLEVFANSLKGYRNLSKDEVSEIVRKQQESAKLSFDELRYLSNLAHDKGVAVASHDDDSLEKLDLMQDLGATISEFPISLEVARSAVDRGMYTVVGAPNILLGKSHSGNLSAREAVENGVATILCSDYYPTALLHSVFRMVRDFDIPLTQAFAMLTINPARAARVDKDLGSIEVGKKADILLIREVVEEERSYPVITAALVDGRVVTRAWYPGLPSLSARFATDASPGTSSPTVSTPTAHQPYMPNMDLRLSDPCVEELHR